MKKYAPVLSVVALIFILGSISAFDKGNITMLQCIVQFVIGAIIEVRVLKSLEV